MSIEKSLERIADALDKIATSPSATVVNIAEETAKEKKARVKAEKIEAAEKEAARAGPEADPLADEKPVSKDEVRAALQDFIATDGKDVAIALLKEHADGAENLSQLKPEHHAAVFEAIASAS